MHTYGMAYSAQYVQSYVTKETAS